MSQAKLGELIDLSQSAVSRIESGERAVDSLELAKLADVLEVSVLSLLADEPLEEDLLSVAPRVEAFRAPGAVDLALSRVRDFAKFERLLRRLGLPVEDRPEPPDVEPKRGLAKSQGRELARDVRRDYELDDDPLTDLLDVVEERLGLDIALEPLPDGVEGLCARLDGFSLALVNTNAVPGRQRFTVAHEVCHYLVGDAEPVHVDEYLFGRELREIRANAFAAHFLMPEEGVRRRIRCRPLDGRSLCELQYTFGVSLEALLWHLQNLGEISPQRRRQFASVGAKSLALRHGYIAEWHSAEQERGQVRSPARIFRSALEAYRQGLIGAERLAGLLGRRDPDDLRRELEGAGIVPDDWPEDTASA